MPMEAILKEINAVIGVTGSFVCLNDASIVAQAVPASIDAAGVVLAARIASQTFLALETSGQRVAEADLSFDQTRLVLKNLRAGVLVILCARTINIPLLNLTATLAARRIATELKLPKALAPEPVAAPAPAPAPSANVPQPPATQVAPLSEINQETGPTIEIMSPPLEPVDVKFFDQLTRELARVVGPAASIIIEDEISALKETRAAFPKTRTAELVERASLDIRDMTKRIKFQQVMMEAIRKL